jgi:excisionase family DNA binding protein
MVAVRGVARYGRFAANDRNAARGSVWVPATSASPVVAHASQRANEQRMSYSLAEAAKATGLYKSTILRSIKAGRLTGTKDARGQWQIEPAELHRVYAPASSGNGAPATQRAFTQATALIEAQARAALAEQRLADLKAALDDMKAQRDKWQGQAEATQRLLADATAKRPWWRRLAG